MPVPENAAPSPTPPDDGASVSPKPGFTTSALQRAFNAVGEMIYKWAAAAAWRIVGPEMAQDVAQDVGLQLWDLAHESHAPLPSDKELKAIVRRAAINSALDKSIKQRATLAQDGEFLQRMSDARPTWADPELLLSEAEFASGLSTAVAALPEGYRTIWALARGGTLSYKEIGERLGLTENGVRTRLRRASAQLRRSLSYLIDDAPLYADMRAASTRAIDPASTPDRATLGTLGTPTTARIHS